jgi:hypothetical protein
MPESLDMGRVVVSAVVESIEDVWRVQRGELAVGNVRRIEISEALIDSETTVLCLPSGLVKQLGLKPCGERVSQIQGRRHRVQIYAPVRLTVQARDCNTEVVELPDGEPALIGNVPLLLLDFVVDPPSRQLIGNLAHSGEQMLELY